MADETTSLIMQIIKRIQGYRTDARTCQFFIQDEDRYLCNLNPAVPFQVVNGATCDFWKGK